MAELTISSDEIRSAIENYVSTFSPETSREEVGVVAPLISDSWIVNGVATPPICGLASARPSIATLAKSSTAITLSGATLTGGSA